MNNQKIPPQKKKSYQPWIYKIVTTQKFIENFIPINPENHGKKENSYPYKHTHPYCHEVAIKISHPRKSVRHHCVIIVAKFNHQ